MYKPCANIIIFCPECYQEAHLESEYGYGPVTPCKIYLGETEVGLVTEVNGRYYLKTQSAGDGIRLEKQYLEALEEASSMIRDVLKT
jgi:hypothetical protein